MKVKVWKLIGLMLIAVFTLSAANASATPTMSSMAGTYSSETSGYNIILYENGTALFSTHSGTWNIVNSTTFEGIYSLLGITQDDYFTITNNGFTAVQTGNVYVKTTSASSSPTASASASPTTSATSTPTVPEFSSVALILVAAAVAVTLCTIELAAKKRHAKKP
jgi:hypothetical protein